MIVRYLASRDAEFQRWQTLKTNREKRHRARVCFVEGVHPIEQAIGHGWEFEAFASARGARLSGWAKDMLERSNAPALIEMPGQMLAELSDREESCELVALVKMREDKLRPSPGALRPPLYMAFDRPQSPGNLGSVIRSADAFGADGLVITGHAADRFDPQCIRASIGTVFALPFVALPGITQFMAWLDTLPQRPRVVGTSARAPRPIGEIDLTRPTLIAVGNETFGLSKAWKEIADDMATIPIGGSVTSLNVAASASILLYEATRQRNQTYNT